MHLTVIYHNILKELIKKKITCFRCASLPVRQPLSTLVFNTAESFRDKEWQRLWHLPMCLQGNVYVTSYLEVAPC